MERELAQKHEMIKIVVVEMVAVLLAQLNPTMFALVEQPHLKILAQLVQQDIIKTLPKVLVKHIEVMD